MTMKKGTKQMLMAVGLLLIAGLIANQMGYLGEKIKLPGASTGGGGNNNTIDDAEKANYLLGIGQFQLDNTAYDSTDPGTVRTIATNLNIFYYHNKGGVWSPGTTASSSTTKYFSATAEDNGYMWCVVEIPSGQAFYVDYEAISDLNSYVTGWQYVDVDKDTVNEFVFQYDLRDHAIPSSGYPIITFNAYILTYDASFTGLNDLANATSIGTSTTTKYYEWYLAFSAEKKGVAIYKVEFKATTTDETKVRLKRMEIPNYGTLDAAQFTKSYTASDIRWTYTFTNNFKDANYLYREINSANKYYMNTQVEYTLVHPDDILITCTVYYLVAQTEAGASTTDSFYAQE